MPTFIAMHKWKTEDDLAVRKEVLGTWAAAEAGKLPAGVKLCLAYTYMPQGAQCIWEAPSKEALEKAFDKFAPILKRYTKIVPAVQAYPPTMEFVISLGQRMLKAASK